MFFKSNNYIAFLISLFVRLSSVFLVQTFFVPDEYWQVLEVAHKIVFNYGYLTWEWEYGIRSYLYPLLIAGYYKILQLVHWDSFYFLVYGPRVLQAVLSAYSDLCFYKWTGNSKWALFNICSCFFWFYTGSRTLINTVECALTTIALSWFPWKYHQNSNFIWLVALLCCMRPTAAIIWTPLCFYHFINFESNRFKLLFYRYLPIGLAVFTISTAIDSWMYNRFVIANYEFINLNLFKNIGAWYGQLPWYWYFISGVPVLLGIYLLPFLGASLLIIMNRKIMTNEITMLGVFIFTVLIYSSLTHKEFRFLLPLLPIAMFITTRFISYWSRQQSRFVIWLVVLFLFLSNLVPALYLGIRHQSGTNHLMFHLHKIAMDNPKNNSFLFLMPCHSTPYYSHIHVNVTMRFLTCNPPLSHAENYIDEADNFYRSPDLWLQDNFPNTDNLPSHVIFFDTLAQNISSFLNRYEIVSMYFHTDFPTERIGRNVILSKISTKV